MADLSLENKAYPAKTKPSAQVIQFMCRAIFLISLPFGILDFVLPIYGKRLGADAVQIGLFFSAFSFMIVVLRPLVGAALDRWGRRPFFLAGLCGYILTMLIFAFSVTVWWIVLARLFQGIASACLWLSAQAITADVAEDVQRGRTFGAVQQSNSQGAILGTFIGFSVLFSLGISQGWRPLFLGFALAGLVGTLLIGRRVVETRHNLHPEASPRIAPSRPWITLLLVAGVTGASWAMLSPVLMIFLQERFTVEVQQLALAFLPAGLVWAMLPSRLGRLADRFGRKTMMAVGMSAAALTSFLVPALTSLAALAAFWAFQAICMAAGDPAEQALVVDLTGEDQRGRAFGVYTMAAGVGAIFGPLAGGWLYQNVSPVAPFFANGLLLAVCTAVLLLFLQEPARRSTTM